MLSSTYELHELKKNFLTKNISTYIRQEISLELFLELFVQLRIDKRLFRQNVSKVILPTLYLTSVLNHVRITTSGEAGKPSSRAFGTASRPSRTDEKNSGYSYVEILLLSSRYSYVEIHPIIHTLFIRRSSDPLLSSRSK